MQTYNNSVFINCPFDREYQSLFHSILFTVHDCGFIARCSLEIIDGGEIRLEKITRLIRACKLGVHDISRTEPDKKHKLPRFNMPLELGLFIGANKFGDSTQKGKKCPILDRSKYRYQKYCSDISGQDIEAHNGNPQTAIRKIRDWLQCHRTNKDKMLPSGSIIFKRYTFFQNEFPIICKGLNLDCRELTYNDRVTVIVNWCERNELL